MTLLVGLVWGGLPSQSVVNTVAASVFQVECAVASGGTYRARGKATAFATGGTGRLVTTLHAVSGCDRITVYSATRRATRQARVERAVSARDLAELSVVPEAAAPWTVAPLPTLNVQPALWEEYAVVGHAVGMPVAEPTPVKWRRRIAIEALVPAGVASQLRGLGWLDVSTEVDSLSGSIAPGHSGAPIVDGSGRVVAIAQGGLENGALEISWGLPVRWLPELAAAPPGAGPARAAAPALFTAGMEASLADAGDGVACGGARLVHVRTASLGELRDTADDPGGLRYLEQWLSGFGSVLDTNAFRYDIWRDLATGATLPVPAGRRPVPDGPRCAVVDPASGLRLLLAVDPVSGIDGAVAASIRFEQGWVGNRPGQLDAAFSYLAPLQRWDGLVANRKAVSLFTLVAGMPVVDEYAFETLSTKGSGALGAVVLKNNMYHELQCAYAGWMLPGCQAYTARHALFAQMVLGVHLSGWPVG